MFPSGKSVGWALAVGLVLLTLLMTASLRRNQVTAMEKERVESVEDWDTGTPVASAGRSRALRQISIEPDLEATASRARLLPPPEPDLPAVEGYLVANFREWKSIPEGYQADGIVLRNGELVLTDSETTPRVGVIQSPPLTLFQPALAAPAAADSSLPAGTGLNLQISLSADGSEWSPWASIERHTPPDGNLVEPPVQPSLAPGSLPVAGNFLQDDQKDTSGPLVRFRLSLSSPDATTPRVSDVRIWKRPR